MNRIRAPVGAPDPDRIQAAHVRAGGFVLLTTLPADCFDARHLLQEYKGQAVAEERLHFLKDPEFVDALFVHKPERVEALGYVLLLACLVLSLLERRVRQGPPLPTLSRGQLERPTGQEILHQLAPCIVLPVDGHTRQLAIRPPFANAWRRFSRRPASRIRCIPGYRRGTSVKFAAASEVTRGRGVS